MKTSNLLLLSLLIRVTCQSQGGVADSSVGSLSLSYVAGGEFVMGCPSNPPSPWVQEEAAVPLHRVQLSSFWIGKFPVTVAQYCEYLNSLDPSELRKAQGTLTQVAAGLHAGKPRLIAKQGQADQPVANITHSQASKFCEWVSGTSGRRCRLPTEAEWEYAARGSEGRVYPWGNEIKPPPQKWLPAIGTNPRFTTPDGIHDLVGSVYQWCLDEFHRNFYRQAPLRNPCCKKGDGRNVIRGGPGIRVGRSEKVFLSPAWQRFANRRESESHIGFRVVVETQ